jgi:hypothetical protein
VSPPNDVTAHRPTPNVVVQKVNVDKSRRPRAGVVAKPSNSWPFRVLLDEKRVDLVQLVCPLDCTVGQLLKHAHTNAFVVLVHVPLLTGDL